MRTIALTTVSRGLSSRQLMELRHSRMKYLPLLWARLWRKPVRTTLTFLSLAAAFLLFGSLYGVSAGFDAAIERVNSHRLRVSSATYGPALPVGYRSEVQRVPGVASIMISTDISAYYQQPLHLARVP